MEKISFERLCDLVSNIDYVFEDSYPIKFKVITDGRCSKYECGIANDFEYDGEEYECQQYIHICNHANIIKNHTIEIEDADILTYEMIEKSLKRCCRIQNDSEIYLYDKSSFSGIRRNIKNIPISFIMEHNRIKTQLDMSEGTMKGIEYLEEILESDTVLISTQKNSLVDLNDKDDEFLPFLFRNRKVLYFDTLTKILYTYYPEIKDTLKRIESNDSFCWILLKVCTGEDLLSSIKNVYIKIEDKITKETKIIENINIDKQKKIISDVAEKLKISKEEVEKAAKPFYTISD